MRVLDGQCDGIIISNLYGGITINNLNANVCDDNSNTSDVDFKFEAAHQQEWDSNKKTKGAFLSKLDSIKDDVVVGKELKLQNKRFDRSQWIDIDTDVGGNDDANQVD